MTCDLVRLVIGLVPDRAPSLAWLCADIVDPNGYRTDLAQDVSNVTLAICATMNLVSL